LNHEGTKNAKKNKNHLAGVINPAKNLRVFVFFVVEWFFQV